MRKGHIRFLMWFLVAGLVLLLPLACQKLPYSEIDGSNDGKIGTSPHPSPGSIARGKKGYFTVKSSQDNVPLRSIEDTVTITLDSGKKISYKVGRMIGADEKLYVRIVLPESVRERKDPHKKT